MDTMGSNVSALSQLGFKTSQVDSLDNRMIVCMAKRKLDSTTRREWKKFVKDDCVTWTAMSDWFAAQWRSLDDSDTTKSSKSSEVKSVPNQEATPNRPACCARSRMGCMRAPSSARRRSRRDGRS